MHIYSFIRRKAEGEGQIPIATRAAVHTTITAPAPPLGPTDLEFVVFEFVKRDEDSSADASAEKMMEK